MIRNEQKQKGIRDKETKREHVNGETAIEAERING